MDNRVLVDRVDDMNEVGLCEYDENFVIYYYVDKLSRSTYLAFVLYNNRSESYGEFVSFTFFANIL